MKRKTWTCNKSFLINDEYDNTTLLTCATLCVKKGT